jgi:hypothetical protein
VTGRELRKPFLVAVDVLSTLGRARHDKREVTSTTRFDDGRWACVRNDNMRLRHQIVQVGVADIVDAVGVNRRHGRPVLNQTSNRRIRHAAVPVVHPRNQPVEAVMIGSDNGKNQRGMCLGGHSNDPITCAPG